MKGKPKDPKDLREYELHKMRYHMTENSKEKAYSLKEMKRLEGSPLE